ncbi:MAG: hypothetical protein LIP01_04135 [Tannerellaceae bacterium]|nr:hypothetical protein [Tannerellaceae bacterium]
MRRKVFFLKGGRVNLNKKLTDKLCKSGQIPNLNFFSPGLLRRINAIHNLTVSEYLAPRCKRKRVLGLGCNMSFWKEDFIKVNGYDEFYEGWGGEDYDFTCRMLNSGVERLYLKFSGIVFHLWHEDFYMYNKEKNQNYYNQRKAEKVTVAPVGVSQYL